MPAAVPDGLMTDVAGWPRWNRLLPHIEALTQHAGPGRTTVDLMEVNGRAAAYRQFQGQVAAIDLFEQVLDDRQRALGDNHPDTQNTATELHSILNKDRRRTTT